MAIRNNIDRLQSMISPSDPSNSTASPANNSGGLFRLQAALNNRAYAQRNNEPVQVQQSTTQVSQDSNNPQNNYVQSSYSDDPLTNTRTGFQAGFQNYQSSNNNNSDNINISQKLGYNTPMGAEDQIKLASKYMDKNLEKDTAITGIASLTNAFGRTGGFSTVFGSYTPK